jgi:hypothetical protein
MGLAGQLVDLPNKEYNMDHLRILKRAFQITLDYRVLWIFGILLALTTAGGSGNPGAQFRGDGGNGGGALPPGDFNLPGFPTQWANALITAAIVLACLILVLAIASAIVRYVSETALIRLVDGHEASGEKLTTRQGFRAGWSRAAFRMFLLDLVIGLGGLVIFLLLLLVAAAPLLVWLTESEPARVVGTVSAIGLILLVIFVGIVAAIAYSLLAHFFRRAIVLEGLGLSAAVRRGVALVRMRLGDVVVMGLIMFALGLAWAILMIPVLIMLVLAGIVIGGLPGLLAFGIARLFAEGALPWIVGGIVGAPIFLLVIAAPALFLNGLAEAYKSGVWTLTYRELLALEAVQPEPPPAAIVEATEEPEEPEEPEA